MRISFHQVSSALRPVRRIVACLLLVAFAICARNAPGQETPAKPAADLGSFLALKEIDLSRRAVFVDEAAWNDDKEQMLLRVLARMTAPANLAVAWSLDAVDVAASGTPTAIGDRLVRVRGRATFVAPRQLPAPLAELAGRDRYDLVRIIDERGAVVDVVTPRAPRAWRRGVAIDEPAAAVGLPLTTGAGPQPDTDTAPWPAAAHDLLLVATSVQYTPPTMLGGLGMDYGLFDTVVDDRKLEPGDTDAFWGVMAASSRAQPAEIARAAGGRTDILPLIDPAQKWFASHRGDPVVIEGVARWCRRIAIDDPQQRAAVGGDHYWELEVFVDTPLLEVNGRQQDRYPIVCCVRGLTEGMPTGDAISERLRVPGFAFKRYSYPLRDALISSSLGDSEIKGERMSTPLVIGPIAEWQQPPSAQGASDLLFLIFTGIIGVLALVMVFSGWSTRRQMAQAERLRRAAMPDRLELPNE
ncbi:MAG: hypothetical protein K8S94_06535 [Planctomycetia bacterium]|nr:hypothetical protein [Planctomycetia bacterium]